MSDPWSHIARCMDLREEDIAQAIRTRDSTRHLLARLAEVSAPDTGAAKVMLVFARMATTACDWLDGGLRVTLEPREDDTRVELSIDMGGGMFERALPPVVLRVPLAEFTRAIERVPKLITPLHQIGRGGRRIVLTASALIRRTSAPPPPIEIAADSLFVHAPALPQPPTDMTPESEPLPVVTAESPSSQPPVDSVDRGWDD
jgi:hypothetical protein